MTENKHWTQFPEFVRAELAAGGPDPQIALIQELSKDSSDQEKVWMAGCYCTCHCVPTAYVTWTAFRPEQAFFDSAGGEVEKWMRENWKWLPVRPEMRSHRMPEKRAKCLKDFAQYALEWTPERTNKPFETVWADAEKSVKYFGRYMNIKFMEILRRMVAPGIEMPDMRAKGSWSPRMALSMLYPGNEILATRGLETKIALQIVDHEAQEALNTLKIDHGIELNLFQLQVLLCEYKEFLHGGYVVGGSHGEELEYIKIVGERFPDLMYDVLRAREKLFPAKYLGEISGWNYRDDIRKGA